MSNYVTSIVVPPREYMDSRWQLCHCRGTSENRTKHLTLLTDYLSDHIQVMTTIHTSNHVTSIVVPHREYMDSRWQLRRCRGTSEKRTNHLALLTNYLPDHIKVMTTIHTLNHVMSIVVPPQEYMDSRWQLRRCRGMSENQTKHLALLTN
jgi:hypothetical protein